MDHNFKRNCRFADFVHCLCGWEDFPGGRGVAERAIDLLAQRLDWFPGWFCGSLVQ